MCRAAIREDNDCRAWSLEVLRWSLPEPRKDPNFSRHCFLGEHLAINERERRSVFKATNSLWPVGMLFPPSLWQYLLGLFVNNFRPLAMTQPWRTLHSDNFACKIASANKLCIEDFLRNAVGRSFSFVDKRNKIWPEFRTYFWNRRSPVKLVFDSLHFKSDIYLWQNKDKIELKSNFDSSSRIRSGLNTTCA